MSFDPLAADYDAAFTHTSIARYLREQVQARLLHHFQPGDHVLELGCGTGVDALFLAEQGIRVTATDASPAMLDQARAKAGGHPLLDFAPLDLNDLPAGGEFAPDYAGVFANFGPLNCLADWRPLARWLAARIQPGGVAAFGVMAPFCLWEMAWHSLHGDFRTAFRRLRKDTPFHPGPGARALTIHYPTVRRLSREFALHFERIYIAPIGLCLPPSDAYGFVEKRPRLHRFLLTCETTLSQQRCLASFADHYWIEFRRGPD